MLAVANGIVNTVIALILGLFFLIGCYGLWDSHNVEVQASSTRWQAYKPVEPEQLSFKELQALNSDVVAWLDIYGTGIDYPVCYNEDIEYYLVHNPKKEYSLTGSLFLDNRNARDFSDFSTIVYGHHMEAQVQFGPLSNFDDETYFLEHEYGNLYAQGRNWGLHFFAYLTADAYDATIYRTEFANDEAKRDYLNHLLDTARYTRTVELATTDRIVVLSTCSSESTNGRTLLVGKICDESFTNRFIKWPNTGTGIDETFSFLGIPVVGWLVFIAWIILLLLLLWLLRRRKKRKNQDTDTKEDK